MKKVKYRDSLILAFFIIITLIAMTGIPRIYIDSGTQVFIPENHEIKAINERIEDEFGLNDSLVMGVQSRFSTVLELDTLKLIENLTKQLESHPMVGQVRSLTNMDFIEAADDGLVVTPVLKDLTPLGVKQFKRRIMDWKEVYLGTFLSEDLHLAALIIQPQVGNTDFENGIIYSFMKELAQENATMDLYFPIAGMPMVKEEINRSLMSDLIYLIPVAAIIIMIILFLSFRRWEGVLFPLISLAVACLWVMGLIGYLKITFTMATLLVPVLLLVVGSAYAIHVLSHFYEIISEHRGFISPAKINEIINNTISKIRLPVILAGLTTAGGFIALVTSPLGPFRAFGLLSAAGVVASQLTSLILLPLLIKLRYRKGFKGNLTVRSDSEKEKNKTGAIFSISEILVKKGKAPALLATLLLILLTLSYLPRIEIGSDMLKFFVPQSQVVRDTEIFNNALGGSNMVTLVIRSPEKGDILNPLFLGNLEDFSTHITKVSSTATQVQSVLPSFKRINQLMNTNSVPYEGKSDVQESDSFFDGGFFGENNSFFGEGDSAFELDDSLPLIEIDDLGESSAPKELNLDYDSLAQLIQDSLLDSPPDATVQNVLSEILKKQNFEGQAYYEIPKDPEKYGMETVDDLTTLLSQYLVFYSGNLDMVINDSLEPDGALITIQVKDISYATLKELREEIELYWDYHLESGWDYEIGGGATLAYILSQLVTRSQFYSIIGALLIVYFMVSIMFRSPVAGLYGMIPVLFSLVGIFLTMALFGFKLDIVTSLLASLAIGIGVDYAIHFMDSYKSHMKSTKGSVLDMVYRTTGRAIFINALSVAFGFLSLMISQFVPIRQMGILFSVAMISACFSSLLILPMALEWGKPAFLTERNIKKGVL